MSERCRCGFLPPLCPTHHAKLALEPKRSMVAKLMGQTICGWRVVERVPGNDPSQPDCVVECSECETRRTITASLVRKSRRVGKPIRCYTCKPHHLNAKITGKTAGAIGYAS